MVVKLAPGADREAARREIAARLPLDDVYTTDEWSQRTRSYWVDSTGLGLNMILTVFLGCFVGALIVAQTIYTSTMVTFASSARSRRSAAATARSTHSLRGRR